MKAGGEARRGPRGGNRSSGMGNRERAMAAPKLLLDLGGEDEGPVGGEEEAGE